MVTTTAPGRRAWLRTALTFVAEMENDVLRRFPAVGGFMAAVERPDDEQSEREDIARLERLLDYSAELSADMVLLQEDSRVLTDLANLMLEVKTDLATRQGGDVAIVEQAAREAALGGYRGRIALGFRYVDYRGLSLDPSQAGSSLLLDQVYVRPRFAGETGGATTKEREAELIRLLDSVTLDEAEKEAYRRELAELSEARWRPSTFSNFSAEDISGHLRKDRPVIILGGPGTGKTTFIRWLTRSCVLGPERRLKVFGSDAVITPVVVRLAEYAQRRRERPGVSVRGFIQERIHVGEGGEALWQALEGELDEGRAIVFLDGVDEEPDEHRRLGMAREVDRFLESTSSICIVTSRPAGYPRLQSDALHLVLPNFDQHQVETFAQQWHQAFERSRHADAPNLEDADRRAAELLSDIGANPRVEQLAANPLMLVMIMLIREHSLRLPDRRVELYDRAVRLLLGVWRRLRSELDTGIDEVDELAIEDLLKALGEVGWWAHHDPSGLMPVGSLRSELTKAIREADPDSDAPELLAQSYLHAAATSAGLLEERAAGVFAFWHLTFEEFLAAAHLARDLSCTKERLLPTCDDARWREVVLLTIGHAGVVHRQERTAGALVEAILSERPGPAESLLHWRVRLSTACIVEDVRVPKATAETVIGRLLEAVCDHPTNELLESLREMAEAVVRQGLKLSLSLRPKLEVAMSARHAAIRRDACRMAAACVVDPDVDASRWKHLLRDREDDVRFQAVILISRYRPEDPDLAEVLSSCCDGAPAWMSPREMQALAGVSGVVGTLGRLLTHQRASAEAAARLLSTLPYSDGVPSYRDDLLEALGAGLLAEDLSVVTRVATRLAEIGRYDPRALSVLEKALRRVDLRAIPVIATRLVQIDSQDGAAAGALLRALGSDEPDVVYDAAEVLLGLGRHDEEIVSAIGRVAGLGGYMVTRPRLNASGIIINALEQGLLNHDLAAAMSAARTLAYLSQDNDRAEAAVVRTLGSADIRTSAVMAAAHATYGTKLDAAFASLERGLATEDPLLLYQVAEGLLQVGHSDKPVMDALKRLLSGSEPTIVINAAIRLAALGYSDPAVVAALERGLKYNDSWDALAAADQLIELGRADDAVVAALQRALSTDDFWLVDRAASHLVALGRDAELVSALDRVLTSGEETELPPFAERVITSRPADDAGVSDLERWLVADNPDIVLQAARRLIEVSESRDRPVDALQRLLSSPKPYTRSEAAKNLAELARDDEYAERALERTVLFGDYQAANAAAQEFSRLLESSWPAIVRLAAPLCRRKDCLLTSNAPPASWSLSAESYTQLAEVLRVTPEDSLETYRRKRLLLWVIPSLAEGEQGWTPLGAAG
jgi:hypothetical protein